MTTKHMGENGYFWFIGIVEDRDDPQQLGRHQVRVYVYYSDNKALLPTEKLPWAFVAGSIYSASKEGIGISPTGIQVGTTVVGFFADGREAQIPIITGTLYGIPDGDQRRHDVPKRARGLNPITKNTLEKEPADGFAARYPYNKVITTESGHTVELDDTPGQERIHIYHRTGSYVEINKDGSVVYKSVKNTYEITTSDNEVFVGGSVSVHVKGNANILVDGTYTLESKGNMVIKAPRVDINP